MSEWDRGERDLDGGAAAYEQAEQSSQDQAGANQETDEVLRNVEGKQGRGAVGKLAGGKASGMMGNSKGGPMECP